MNQRSLKVPKTIARAFTSRGVHMHGAFPVVTLNEMRCRRTRRAQAGLEAFPAGSEASGGMSADRVRARRMVHA